MIWIPIAIGGVVLLALATSDEEIDPLNIFPDKLPSKEEPVLSNEELSEIKKQRNSLNRKLKQARKRLTKSKSDPESD